MVAEVERLHRAMQRSEPRDVYCANPLCRGAMKRGRRAWLGRHSGHGEAKCPECRQLTSYDHDRQ